MRAEVRADMEKSIMYVKEATEILSGLLGGWHLMRVEGKEDEVCRVLDMKCGIDYLMYNDVGGQVYGLTSRVQYGKNYRTFTMRKERESGASTEYEKLAGSRNNGGLTAYYTMQMYVEDGRISGLGMVKTEDLLKFIGRGLASENKTGADKAGQAKFYVCGWDKLKDAGYTVKEYARSDEDNREIEEDY